MSNLAENFKNHKAFIPFIVVDDPDFNTTVENVVALAKGGANIVELGIPFSDPVADGPIIQAADLRAFNSKVKTETAFKVVEMARKKTKVPIVFLTYLNIVFKYGYNKFLKHCNALNISGLVIPDLPYESRGEIVPISQKYDIDIIPLITPTSDFRVKKIARSASGFIYVVSSKGVTGERNKFFDGLKNLVAEIRKYTTLSLLLLVLVSILLNKHILWPKFLMELLLGVPWLILSLTKSRKLRLFLGNLLNKFEKPWIRKNQLHFIKYRLSKNNFLYYKNQKYSLFF